MVWAKTQLHLKDKPFKVAPLKNQRILQGQDVIFVANVQGESCVDILWKKDGKPISKSHRIKMDSEDKKYTMKLSKATISDSGEFSFIASNNSGEAEIKAQLDVCEKASIDTLLQDITVIEGETIKLNIITGGEPKPLVHWEKNHEVILPGLGVQTNTFNNSHDLEIRKALRQDTGFYEVIASNFYGLDSTSVNVHVKVPPEFIQNINDKDVICGANCQFDAIVIGDPEPNVEWFLNKNLIQNGNTYQIIKNDNCYSLKLSDISIQMEGIYQAVASNCVGTSKSQCILNVYEAPRFIKPLENLSVVKGKMMMLEAKLAGSPSTLEWFHNKNLIEPNENVKICNAYPLAKLVIECVQIDDGGEYDAIAKNSAGIASCNASILVQAEVLFTEMPKIEKELEDVTTIEGLKTKFDVVFSGSPAPTVQWYRENIELCSGEEYVAKQIGLQSSLEIEKTQIRNTGKFKVLVRNCVGSCETTGYLKVVTKPVFTKQLKEKYIAIDGNTFVLEVSVKGVPTPLIQFLNTESKEKFRGGINLRHDGENSFLEFENVSLNDAGKYICSATNEVGTSLSECLLDVYKKPIFKKMFENMTLVEHDSLVLEAEVNGIPPPVATWKHNEKTIIPSDGIEILSSGPLHSICIKAVQLEHKGDYELCATNEAGISSTTAKVVIQVLPVFLKSLHDINIIENSSVVFEVVISGSPFPELTWYKDDRLIMEGEGLEIKKNEDIFILKITESEEADSGTYTAVASNILGSVSTKSVLCVGQCPKITTPLTDQSIICGQKMEIMAKILGSPFPQVIWHKENDIVNEDETLNLKVTTDSVSLIKAISSEKDGANYTLTLENMFGKFQSKAKIKILVPPVFKLPLEDVTILEGKELKLTISVASNPKADIFWLKDDKTLKNINKNITLENELIIFEKRQVNVSDAGLYKVIASNLAGEASSIGKVSVHQAPFFDKKLIDLNILINEECVLTVIVNGLPHPEVVWNVNGENISDDAHYTISVTNHMHSLLIKTVNERDCGVISAIASNSVGTTQTSATINVHGIPEFTKSIENTTCNAKEHINLDFSVSGFPEPQVSILVNNMEPNKELFQLEKDDSSYHMIFKEILLSHAATYKIQAMNEAGEAFCEFTLTVQDYPHLENLENITVNENDSALLSVDIFSIPNPSVDWYKDERILDETSNIHFKQKENTYFLLLDCVSEADGGLYKVKAVNDVGEAIGSAELTVLVPPVFENNLSNKTVTAGSMLELFVVVRSNPKANITWYKDEEPIGISERLEFSNEERIYKLSIKNVQKVDGAVYAVSANNILGEARTKAKISIQAAALLIKPLANICAKKGDAAKFHCIVTGLPYPIVKWSKNNEEIVVKKDYQIFNEDDDHFLIINNLLREDTGIYSVAIKNESGHDSSSAELEVYVPPEILDLPKVLEIKEGSSVEIKAKIVGVPVPDIVILKENEKISISHVMKISNDEYLLFALNNVTILESATYSVITTNAIGRDEKSMEIVVQAPPKVEFLDENYVVGLSECLTISVIVSGVPEPKVVWNKNGEHVIETENVLLQKTQTIHHLIIKKAFKTDSGSYKIIASNCFGTVEAKCNIAVEFSPELLENLNDSEVVRFTSLLLEVIISGCPSPQVLWSKNENIIEENSNFSIINDNGKYSLLIKEVTEQNVGLYKVTASNSIGKISSEANVAIIAEPTLSKLISKKLIVGETEEIKIDFFGIPEPDITWKKDDNFIQQNERIKLYKKEGQSVLVISKIEEVDEGMYDIEAINKAGKTSTSANLTVQVLPRFDKALKDIVAKKGEDVQFEARCYAKPPPDIMWLKNNKPLLHSKNIFITQKDGFQQFLRISAADVHDCGEYSVIASNAFGEAKTSGVLEINAPPSIDKEFHNETVLEGTELKLEAIIDGMPFPQITWFKDDQAIDLDSDYTFEQNGGLFKFVIKSVSRFHSGKYKLIAENNVGIVQCEAEVKINTKPKFLLQIENLSVAQGDPVQFKAEISGIPFPNVVWLKNNKEITDNTTILNKDGNICNLNITTASSQDAGTYAIKIENEFGFETSEAQLNVIVVPSFEKQLQDVTVNSGDKISLQVAVSGDPSPKIEWFKDEEIIDSSCISNENNKYSLILNKVSEMDAGLYCVKATNSGGYSESKAKVIVFSQPIVAETLNNIKVKEGEMVEFVAKLKGLPIPDITWKKDSAELKNNDKNKFIALEESHTYILKILNVSLDDAGEYQIIGKNCIGECSCSARLFIFSAPRFEKKLTNINVLKGKTLELEVILRGNPSPDVSWFKDDKEINNDQHTDIVNDTSSYKLLKNNTSDLDAGKYKIIAKNHSGICESECIVSVLHKPEFALCLKDLTIIENEELMLTAKVAAIPPPKVKWFKEDREIKSDQNIKISNKGNVYSLLIKKVSLTDSGTFLLKCENSGGNNETKSIVTVHAPPTIEKKLKDITVIEGQDLIVEAKFKGKPDPEIKWYKDDNLISEGKFFFKDNCKILIIENIRFNDSGLFKAIATNIIGECRTNCKVKVLEPPSFTNSFTDVVLTEKQMLKLEILINGHPDPTVTWEKDGKKISEKKTIHDKIATSKNGNLYALTIPKILTENAGLYKVIAKNEAGEIKCESKVKVQTMPKFTKALKDTSIYSGKDLSLEVTVIGNPLPEIKWLKDDHLLELNEIKSKDTTFSLNISNIAMKNSGTYKVVATNPAGEATCSSTVTVKAKPKFIEVPKDTSTGLGNKVCVCTKVEGIPFPTIKWEKDQKDIIQEDGFNIITEDDKSMLSIESTKIEMSGCYTITATNEFGSDQCKFTLDVLVAPFFKVDLNDQVCIKGKVAQFEITVEGNPIPMVTWFKDEKEIAPGDGITFRHSDNTWSVSINDTGHEDKGVYKAVAKNVVGEVKSEGVLQILEPPSFTEKIIDAIGILNESLLLKCSAKGSPLPMFQWFKDKQPIDSRRLMVETSEISSCLNIPNLLKTDAGKYKVIVNNAAGECSSVATVNIQVKPIIIKELKNLQVIEGEHVIFETDVDGDPLPKIFWYKDNMQIIPDETLIIESVGKQQMLKIIDVVEEDAGVYSLKASNIHGETSTESELSVLGPPCFTLFPSDLEVKINEKIVLKAEIKSNLTPEFHWYFNDKEIISCDNQLWLEHDEHNLTTSLTILSVTAEHGGVYLIVAKNAAGSAKTSSNLIINCMYFFLRIGDHYI